MINWEVFPGSLEYLHTDGIQIIYPHKPPDMSVWASDGDGGAGAMGYMLVSDIAAFIFVPPPPITLTEEMVVPDEPTDADLAAQRDAFADDAAWHEEMNRAARRLP